jgi:hypothetical protein
MTNISDFLSYDELQNAIENDGTENNFKTAADFLLSAVTDYPTFNLKEPTDLVAALRQAINEKLTFDNLDYYLKTLSPDKDAWTIEAINSLIEMFDFERKNIFDKAIELDKIIQQLTQHYRQMSFEKVILAWRQAADDLQIKIQSPFVLTTTDNRNIEYELLIENFGGKLGTLIFSTDNMTEFDSAEQFGYYCSALNPDSYSTYDKANFIDTLNDWGYYGDTLNKPNWYS